MRLKTVVFPAPFGPINPTSAVSPTDRETPLTAFRPPKLFSQSLSSRRDMLSPQGHPKVPAPFPKQSSHGNLPPSHDPLRAGEHQQDQEQGVEELPRQVRREAG